MYILHNRNKTLFISEFINTICLPKDFSKSKPKHNLIVAGWGDSKVGKSTNIMLKSKVNRIPINHCNDIFKIDFLTERTNICILDSHNVNSCSGASGGPTFSKTAKKYVQYGIQAVTYKNCGRNMSILTPNIHINVANYIEWIESEIY